jgi:serine/threonine kinase 32
MKVMSKVKIIKKNSVKNIMNEKNVLSKLQNPFIVNMILSFQDKDNLYLVMDLLLGGDLRYHINHKKKFNEKELKFILSCTILGLDYLHRNNIIHKDIKPDNLVFDSKGYLHITDLGISKIYHEDNGKENSGTPGYMAPEVLFNKNHKFSVDFYALGVVGYEIIIGKRPYNGKDKKELRKDIISRQARIKETNMPKGWTEFSIEFINGCIQRKAELRLGNSDINEIKDNPWFSDINWDDLLSKKIDAPFIPSVDCNFYRGLGYDSETIGEDTELLYEEIKSREEYSKYFENYTFNGTSLNNNLNIHKSIEAKNEMKYKPIDNNIKIKYEMMANMINKSKKEALLNFSDKKSNNESLIKKNFIIIDKINKKQKNSKLQISSMRYTKSHLLSNHNKKNEEIKLKSKINLNSNSIIKINDSKINDNSSIKYISPISNSKNNNKKKKYNDKKTIKLNVNEASYRSKYSDKSLVFNIKNKKKDNSIFRSTNNFNFLKKYEENHLLPVIKALQKSASSDNYDKSNKSSMIMNQKNDYLKNNLSNYYSQYFNKTKYFK